MNRRIVTACLGLLLAGIPRASEAHLVATRLGNFYDGAVHPLTGFEYALPWLALAILAALQGTRSGRWLFLIFPLGLLAGGALSMLVPATGLGPLLNLLSIAGLGLLVALAVVLPVPAFMTVAAAVAIVQGYENGRAMTADTNHMLFIGGVAAAGYAFVALVTGLMIAFLDGRGAWRPIALRAAGSWIAAVGVMVLSLTLTQFANAR